MENTYLVISKFQNHGVIRNHNHLSAVISAQAGIRLFKITALSDTTTIFPSSFPRKRESSNEKQQEFIGNGWSLKVWIPAFAGMTIQKLHETQKNETKRTGFPLLRE